MDANFLQQLAAGATGGTQMMKSADGQDLLKALEASNYQTDVSTLTGGGALGLQSLDNVMKATVQSNKHFTLMNQLRKTSPTNIVDEYVTNTNVGGFLGGSANSQMGTVRSAVGSYNREVGYVKFMMTLRQVGYIANLTNNISEPVMNEEMNGAKQLLTDAEYQLFHGDDSVCPVQFNGIFRQIDAAIAAGKMSSDNVVDVDGAPLTNIEEFSRVNTAVSSFGSWGKSTDVFLPNSVQTDLNYGLDPAFRWVSEGDNTPVIGAHVQGIRLTHGMLKTNMNTFLHDEFNPMVKPFEATYPVDAAANVSIKPVSATPVAAANGSSRFTATRAGNYYYAVAGIDGEGKGMSAVVLSAQVAVASGDGVTLTIVPSASGAETGYAIYRCKQNGGNTASLGGGDSDFRLMRMVPKASSGNTVYLDLNKDIPGSVSVPVLDMSAEDDAIDFRQFLPMTKWQLPNGIGFQPVLSWMQFYFGYLRIAKPKYHGYIKNIVPSKAAWRPFTGE